MAVPLHLTGASCLQSKIGVSSPQASLNCATKIFTGLKSQSTSLFSSSAPNLSVEFYQKVHNSLQIRSRNKRAGGRISMMPIGTPRVPYKTPGEKSYQWVDLWNAFYRERVVFLGQTIDEDFSNQMLATLLYLDSLGSSESIILYINSPGGDLTPCLALYDTVQSLQTSVATYCVNFAGDMAGFILASGDKGKRVAMPLAKVVIRSPEASARGRADDVQVEAKELFRIRDHLFNEFAKQTGQPIEKVRKDLSRTKYFRTEEAIAYGIIDHCVRPARAIEEELLKEEGSTPPPPPPPPSPRPERMGFLGNFRG